MNEPQKLCNQPNYYGFTFHVSDLFASANVYPNPETIDITYELIQDKVNGLYLREYDPGCYVDLADIQTPKLLENVKS